MVVYTRAVVVECSYVMWVALRYFTVGLLILVVVFVFDRLKSKFLGQTYWSLFTM